MWLCRLVLENLMLCDLAVCRESTAGTLGDTRLFVYSLALQVLYPVIATLVCSYPPPLLAAVPPLEKMKLWWVFFMVWWGYFRPEVSASRGPFSPCAGMLLLRQLLGPEVPADGFAFSGFVISFLFLSSQFSLTNIIQKPL